MSSDRSTINPQPSTVPHLQSGDIVCCWGTDRVSRVISFMTSWYSWIYSPWGLKWSPSHVAIIFQAGEQSPLWYESTTLVHGTSGVQVHEPAERFAAYPGRCVIYRLTAGAELDSDQQTRLGRRLQQLIEQQVPYDLAGAVFSGTVVVQKFLPSRTRSMFCSELIARLLQEIGLMNRTSASKYSPGRLLRELVWAGTYEKVNE